MSDPLSQVVELLSPRAAFANVVSGKGNWAVHYSEFGKPSFCVVLEGSCRLTVRGHAPLDIRAGDFVLLPTTPAFTLSSFIAAPPVHFDPDQVAGGTQELRYGEPTGSPDMRSLGGSFEFDSANSSLLVSLLPDVVHVRESARLAQLVQLVGDEASGQMPGSELIRSRLIELMLIEAMRATTTGDAPPGLLRGLGDKRLAVALKQMHANIAHAWTVEQLAAAASLSRSAFFARFSRKLGMAPKAYLHAWRMEVAKERLRRRDMSVTEVAESVGYGSASAFSVAFARHVGLSPGRYSRGVEVTG